MPFLLNIIYYAIGIIVVCFVADSAYRKHSLSYSGTIASALIGSLHILAGWRYASLLLFFFVSSSKLTKMWSNVKKQKEDDFTYGGERNAYQVISNSFIPSIISIYVIMAKCGLITMEYGSLRYQENMLLLPTVLSYYCECCADTWGSEIGIISSTPHLLLLPWRPVPAGTNGGISILGMGAAIASGIFLSFLFIIIQPSYPYLSVIEIFGITMSSAILGTFLDSLLGSIFELSWWCAERSKVVSRIDEMRPCCHIASASKNIVLGYQPKKCGLICGSSILSGCGVNLICSSVTSLFVFVGLLLKYWL